MELRDSLRETAKQVLGVPKKKKKKWILDETWGKIEERGKINVRLLDENIGDVVRRDLKQQYAEAERDVKHSVRRDKRRFVDHTAKEAEDAARQQD